MGKSLGILLVIKFPSITTSESSYSAPALIISSFIAKKQVEIAQKEGANILAHGCTGKGNDQIRFEFIWMQLLPNVQIISPWKQDDWLSKFKGRKDLINYALEHNISCDVTKEKPYSTDENLMHISYESGILENASCKPKEEMFKLTKSPKNAPDKETEIIIEFKEGIPVKIINKTENKTVNGSLELFSYLNTLAGENGIGRIDIVEDRYVGIKSRGVSETPAGTVLYKAHKDLETLVLDREVIHLKEQISPKIAQLIYNGFWYSPEMKFFMAAIDKSQVNVTGKVYLTLYKGNVIVTGRESKYSLYNEALSSMDIEGGYDQKDADGFIKISGLRLKLSGDIL
jgi:argininosuccinate synthase